MQGKINKHNHNSLSAFTLIELIIVMVVLGIVGVLAVPMFSQAGEIRLRQVAQQMATTIRYAQSTAIAFQQPCQVVADSDANTFELRDQSDGVMSDQLNNVSNWSSGNLFSVNFNDNPRYPNIGITKADFDGSNRLWFDLLGAPYSGPIIDNSPLIKGVLELSSGDATVTLQVEPVTGNVVVGF